MDNLDEILGRMEPHVNVTTTLRRLMDKYDPDGFDILAEEEKNLLVSSGVFIGTYSVTHDIAVKEAIAVAKSLVYRECANQYVAGLTSGDLYRCSALVSKVILDKMGYHDFVRGTASCCSYCSSENESTADLTFSNIIRVKLGGFVKTHIDLLWFNILMAAKLQPLSITPEQIAQFNSLMDTLRGVEPTCKPNDLVKILRKKLPYSTTEETRRAIVEHWGALSILETQEHQGFLYRYTSSGHAPRKRHSSDWAYPVDWWTGKDGVNEEALKHWFGHLI